jgi:hypothetical protein
MCILPVDYRSEGHTNLVGRYRTLKAMQATLWGIPIVSSRWIDECVDAKSVKIPSSLHFVRSLPTKHTQHLVSDYGIAYTAWRLQQDADFQLLPHYMVYLCKPYSERKEADIASLVKASGAEMILHASKALTKAKKMDSNNNNNNASKMVVLSDDTEHDGISDALKEQIYQNPQYFLVVNSQWLFDSISNGKTLAAIEVYMPLSSGGRELWEVTIASL